MDPVSACQSPNASLFARHCHPMNISRAEPEAYAVPLYGYVTPAIVAVTIVTNTFIVVVLSQKHLRTPTNHVLLTMAVAELFTGLSSTPWMMYYYTLSGYINEREYGLPVFWCHYYPLFAVTAPTIFHTSAIFLTVYLAVQRYIYVCRPRRVAQWCSRRQTQVVIVLLCATAVLTELPAMLMAHNVSVLPHSDELDEWSSVNKSLSPPRRLCVRVTHAWVYRVGMDRVYTTLYWTKAVGVHALPCVVLAGVTLLLVGTIRRTDRKRSMHAQNHPKASAVSMTGRSSQTPLWRRRISASTRRRRGSTSVRSLNATTRMLVVVIGIFLLIEIPVAVFLIFYVLISTGSLFGEQAHVWVNRINVALVFRNVLIIATYPLNFAIYCGMSNQFRVTVRQMFGRRVLCRRQQQTAPAHLRDGLGGNAATGFSGLHRLKNAGGASGRAAMADDNTSTGGGMCLLASPQSALGASSYSLSPYRSMMSMDRLDRLTASGDLRQQTREDGSNSASARLISKSTYATAGDSSSPSLSNYHSSLSVVNGATCFGEELSLELFDGDENALRLVSAPTTGASSRSLTSPYRNALSHDGVDPFSISNTSLSPCPSHCSMDCSRRAENHSQEAARFKSRSNSSYCSDAATERPKRADGRSHISPTAFSLPPPPRRSVSSAGSRLPVLPSSHINAHTRALSYRRVSLKERTITTDPSCCQPQTHQSLNQLASTVTPLQSRRVSLHDHTALIDYHQRVSERLERAASATINLMLCQYQSEPSVHNADSEPSKVNNVNKEPTIDVTQSSTPWAPNIEQDMFVNSKVHHHHNSESNAVAKPHQTKLNLINEPQSKSSSPHPPGSSHVLTSFETTECVQRGDVCKYQQQNSTDTEEMDEVFL